MKKKGMAMVLCLVLLAAMAPARVYGAEAEPLQAMRTSEYIRDYNVYISRADSGTVRIAFSVYATMRMDDVGATRIYIYGGPSEDQMVLKHTFYESTSPTMIASDAMSHSSSVTYTGQAGYYYKALVYVRATKDGVWDSRNTWTSTVKV